jgi:hypothetical protein
MTETPSEVMRQINDEIERIIERLRLTLLVLVLTLAVVLITLTVTLFTR